MRIGLDTSVVVRLLTGEPRPVALAAGLAVEAALASGHEVRIGDLVLAETYFALQHHYGLSKARSLDALRELLRRSGLRASRAASEVLATPRLATARPGFVDRLIHRDCVPSDAAARSDRMWTCEREAGKLAGVEVIAPS